MVSWTRCGPRDPLPPGIIEVPDRGITIHIILFHIRYVSRYDSYNTINDIFIFHSFAACNVIRILFAIILQYTNISMYYSTPSPGTHHGPPDPLQFLKPMVVPGILSSPSDTLWSLGSIAVPEAHCRPWNPLQSLGPIVVTLRCPGPSAV